jgi:hypothetical protein
MRQMDFVERRYIVSHILDVLQTFFELVLQTNIIFYIKTFRLKIISGKLYFLESFIFI